MEPTHSNLFKLHFIVLIYGFTAVLGKLIQLDAIVLVAYRMLIAIIGFYIYLRFKHINFNINRGLILKILFTGVIVGIHWLCFFGAVKLSNISVTLGCLASTTLFTSIIEPIVFKRRISKLQVFIGLVIIVGLYLIFQFETRYFTGIIVALISALTAAVFTVFNKVLVKKTSSAVISFYEMIGGFTALLIFIILTIGKLNYQLVPSGSDFIYLIILGTVCTAFAFAVQVDVMKYLSAFTVALTINLEPIYGIILALLFFKNEEFMSIGFYIGTIVILIAVFGYPIFLRLKKRINY